MALDRWRIQLSEWRSGHPGATTAVHDFDADGLCSAALWKLACHGSLSVAPNRQELPPLTGEPLATVYLLDLSCPEERFPWPWPTVVIDHHSPPKSIPNCLMLNCHDWQPPACTSLMVHWLLWGDDSPHAWIAAVGALSDLGDAAPFEILQNQLARWGEGQMRQLTSLVNSPHRADGDCSMAVTALLEHGDPTSMLRSQDPAVLYLRQCRSKVRKRLNQAKGAAPTFFGNLAVVEFSSDCSVQSIIAQIWRMKLPGHVILVANRRSDRAQVHLSARSKAPLNAIEELQERGLRLRGHPGSAGTVLSSDQWDEFRSRLHAHSH